MTTTPAPPPRIRILRRNQLLRLIQAAPAKRYEELQRFIDVEKVERSENALRDAAFGARTDLEAAVRQRADAEVELQEVWTAEGQPGTDAISWAVAVAAQDASDLDRKAQRLRSAQQLIDAAESALVDYRSAVGLTVQMETEAQALEQEVARLPGIDAQQAISLADTLRTVKRHLDTGVHPDECPVCGQGMPLERLKMDIHDRLVQMKQYDDLRARRETVARRVQGAGDVVSTKRDVVLATAAAVLAIVQKGEIEIIAAAGIRVADLENLGTRPEANPDAACDEAKQLVAVLTGLRQALSAEETANLKRSGQINSVRAHVRSVQAGIESTERLKNRKDALDAAYEVVRLTRIQFTQKVLDDVASECNRLYALVHPDEDLAISRLQLDPKRRASLNQSAMFEGFQDVPPQAYFSESHLDTLGFCFWLAIAKQESPKRDAVIVLDDVFTSVDAQHLSRVAQLITDESQHFAQVIAMTHQRQWRDLYKYQHGAGKLTETIELQGWSLAKGVTSYKTRLAVDELVASLKTAPFDRHITAQRSGVLLEATLDFLALQYRCRVARRPDASYTLGELLDGTESLFKKLEVHRPALDGAGNPTIPPKYDPSSVTTIANELRGLTFVRNQVGAHFNVAGAAISDLEVQRVAELTINLAEALSCLTCGQIPGRKAAGHFQCSCAEPREVRMLPLQI